MKDDKDKPNPNFLGRGESVNNLTRRELFAAMAMQGWLACPNSGDRLDKRPIQVECAAKSVAYADALIAELDK